MVEIPFQPSIPFYRFAATIADTTYLFDVRWNTRDSAWVFDLLDLDESPIMSGCKIVLGALMGRQSLGYDDRFPLGVFVAGDLSGEGRDAGFDDLGARVRVYFIPGSELV